MRPLKQIIDEVKIDLKQFTDDDRINHLDRLLQDKANDIRMALIKSEYDNKKRFDDKYYQKACCIEIECVQPGCVIDGETVQSGTVLWKTKNLPNLIAGVGDMDLKYLGLDDLQHGFKRVSLSGLTSSDGDIWNNDVLYHLVENTAYFKNLPTSGITFICAIGIWERPTSVCDYSLMTDIYPVPSLYRLKTMMRIDILKSWGYLTEEKIPTGEEQTISMPASTAKTVNTDTGE